MWAHDPILEGFEMEREAVAEVRSVGVGALAFNATRLHLNYEGLTHVLSKALKLVKTPWGGRSCGQGSK
jgi:hypothetical protein